MASIKLRPGSKNYVACYTLPNGLRKQVSTQTDDRLEAERIANRLEQACQLAIKKTLTKQRALAIVDEIVQAAELDFTLIDATTTRRFIDRYMATHKAAWSAATVRKREATVKDFYAHLKHLADQPIGGIDSSVITSYRDWLTKEGLASKTVKNHLYFLRQIFTEAVSQGRITENPALQVKPPRKMAGERESKQPFTQEQFRKILDACPTDEWRIICLLAGYSGQRERDCQLLTWAQVNWDAGLIDFRRSKNSDAHVMPMHPTLRAKLRDWHQKAQGDNVLPDLCKLKGTGEKTVSRIFVLQILPAAGIEQPVTTDRKITGRGRKVNGYSFHSFRHMLSTALNEAGASEVDRMRLIGHTTKDVSRHYTHAQLKHITEVLARVPGV